MLTRLIDELLPGIQVPPAEVMLMGDAQCTIACVEADNRVLDIWFSNRVAEVQDRMESWKRKGIKVNNLYHWPGERNVADLGTKGRAEGRDIIQGSEWQDGPVRTRYPVEEWPISRDFVREVPEEEKRAAVYGIHQSLSLPSEIQDKNREGKLGLRRKVVHQVAAENLIQGQTGSHEGFDQHLGHERRGKEQGEQRLRKNKGASQPAILRILELWSPLFICYIF